MAKTLMIIVLFYFGCCTVETGVTPTEIRVLYVGNSLTYTNDLPQLVQDIGRSEQVPIRYKSLLFPNYSLEDHWKEGKVQQEIESGQYDFIVAQQGPSALPESQVLLLEYTKKIAELCQKHHTKLALYMVWPSLTRSFDLDNVIFSYTQAAVKTNSLLCPAGLAWKYAWQADPKIALYGNDGFHPATKGSLLAAMVVYASLFQKKEMGFLQPEKIGLEKEINRQDFDVLRDSALKAMNN
ncbi:MAG: hypothetical protein U0X91_23160 [Spirosomataceae bacterium]